MDTGVLLMRMQARRVSWRALLVVVLCWPVLCTQVQAADRATLKTISTQQLLQLLKGRHKPLLFHVGPHMLYEQAHIPGSEYLGAGASQQGIQNLRQRVRTLHRSVAIILYCGCCPWSHCPNVNPAYDALRQLGFTNVKVLYLANNFGMDWVDKGYPVARGE